MPMTIATLLLSAALTAAPGPKRSPVLLELFSSEGCSSCPPADELLRRLDEEQSVEGAEVVALELHVDYWNRLGWTDPFSSADYSARQSLYSAAFGRESVYTPQLVVDGAAELVGSEEARARQVIAAAARRPKAEVKLERRGDALAISVPHAKSGATPEVWLAIAERGLSTAVPKGENAGRTLVHGPVARTLTDLGPVTDGRFERTVPLALPKGVQKERAVAVVFVQDPESRRVVGVAALPLATGR